MQPSEKASFLIKLYRILQSQKYTNCINWSLPDGLSFIIVNKKLFEKKILPKFFHTRKFASFHRQLNLYNFRKKKDENGEKKYFHKEFNKWKSEKQIQLIKKEPKISRNEEPNEGGENKIENNKEENQIIEINQFENLDENSKQIKCENIIKKEELSKNDNQLLLIYLLGKIKGYIETIKSLLNEIEILKKDKINLNEQIKQFENNYKNYYLQNKNDKIKPAIINLNINDIEEMNKDNDINFLNINKEGRYDKHKDFVYMSNSYYKNKKSILKSSQNSNNCYNINNEFNYYYNNNAYGLKSSQISNYNNCNSLKGSQISNYNN